MDDFKRCVNGFSCGVVQGFFSRVSFSFLCLIALFFLITMIKPLSIQITLSCSL